MLSLIALAAAKDDSPPPPQPTALLQVWATAWDQDVSAQSDPAGYGDPEDDPGFKVRRARVGFTQDRGELPWSIIVGAWAGADGLTPDSESLQIVDAWAGYRPNKTLTLTAGVQKLPVGRENLMSTSQVAFQERTMGSAHLAPQRDIGVLVDYEPIPTVRVRAGAFNGNGMILGDTDRGVMGVGRVEYRMGPGNTYKTFGEVERFTLGVGAWGGYNPQMSTNTVLAGADIIVRTGGLSVMAEGAYNQVTAREDGGGEVPGVLAPTARMSVMGQVGYTVGVIEPMVRVELFNDDTSSEDNGDILQGVVGATAHFKDDHARVGAGFVHRQEMAGNAIPNDTARLWMQLAW